ncbi:family 78 glycoside hydrolase [Cryphonectria parasitica EP155]|uniref:Family 78 glycoside hydrolase n=1 Tax=Cryphonectria parasitica (strain ATCC 38755 / EP155) TaxID=660469 RepID=A0A9P4YAF4_CRYP1|nr:family 78 glycoside hydrolase [Cryphonectria parasitica EP155]KAF3769463.1 family 78 glycoside hydrolase [Cryphonectria parasitica EP155]
MASFFGQVPGSAALVMLLIASLIPTLTIGTAAPQQRGKCSRQTGDTSWHQYVRGPSSTTISPVELLASHTTGNITNPDGIVGDGVTTLTRSSEDEDMPTIVLDFGQNYPGILSINFAGAEASGSSSNTSALPGITLAFSESLEYLTNRSDFTRSDNLPAGEKVTNGTDQVAVQSEPYTWTNQLGCAYEGSKVCSDGFHGFRYLRITLQALASDAPYTTGFGSVSIDSVSLAYSAYQGTPDTFTGWFECSDPDITSWWYDAVYTNDLCTDIFRANESDPRDASDNTTMLGKVVLYDGAKRDRDPYAGDLAVSALTLYLSHNNPDAAKNVLSDLAVHQRSDGWIPPASINDYTLALYDYPLWWVVCSSDLVLYTGDTDYLGAYYATMVNTLDTYYPNSTNEAGLLEKGLGTSSGYGDYAFLPRSGVITYYNALYILALNRAALLADTQGETDDAARWRARAAGIGPALLSENWDSTVGALYDGGPCGTNDTEKCPTHAQDGNGLAILSGATNNSYASSLVSTQTTVEESIFTFMTSALTRFYGNAFYDNSLLSPSDEFDQRVYAFISYFELAARFQTAGNLTTTTDPTGVASSAFNELRRLYGHMANNDPFSTFWEGIGPNGSYYEQGYTSLAHGWSTCIVPLMQNYVLGVTPTGSGFSTFDVKPVVVGGGLEFAKGVVPTPNGGGISVGWEVADTGTGSGLTLTISTPTDTTGQAFVPVASSDNTVAQDGTVIWTRSGGVVSGTAGVSFDGGYVVVGLDGGSSHNFTTTE